MSQPKVLFIIPGFGTEMRGVETHFESLSTRITDKVDVHLLSKSHSRKLPSKIQNHMIKSFERKNLDWIYRIPFLSRLLKRFFLSSSTEMEAFLFCVKAIPFMLGNRFDIIIPSAGFWTICLAKFFGKSAKIMSIGHSGFVRKEARLSDFFVALTPNALELANQKLPDLDTEIIPNGVDIKRFQNFKKIGKEWDILSVGAFTPDKGHIDLLNALLQIPGSLNILLAGKGPLERDLRNHDAFKRHNIQIKEFPFEEMPAVYNNAKIFTLASREEAFGLVYLEALSSGMNCVLNDIPNHRYVCGNIGFYCDVSNSKSYAEKLLEALKVDKNDLNRQQAEKFSWESISGKYIGSMNRLLQR